MSSIAGFLERIPVIPGGRAHRLWNSASNPKLWSQSWATGHRALPETGTQPDVTNSPKSRTDNPLLVGEGEPPSPRGRGTAFALPRC